MTCCCCHCCCCEWLYFEMSGKILFWKCHHNLMKGSDNRPIVYSNNNGTHKNVLFWKNEHFWFKQKVVTKITYFFSINAQLNYQAGMLLLLRQPNHNDLKFVVPNILSFCQFFLLLFVIGLFFAPNFLRLAFRTFLSFPPDVQSNGT